MSKSAIMSKSITKDRFLTSDTISVLLQILMNTVSKTTVKTFGINYIPRKLFSTFFLFAAIASDYYRFKSMYIVLRYLGMEFGILKNILKSSVKLLYWIYGDISSK